MKFSKDATRTTVITFAVLASLVVLLAFQNCAPALPLDGVVSSSPASVRATATPAAINTNVGSTGTYSGSSYDGVCTSSYSDDAMALDTNSDVAGAPLIAFNNSSNGRAAFWNLSSGALNRASVCYMTTSGWSVQAVGDFDGDLNPDVIWRNTDGRMVVWLMRGSTRISTALVATVPTTYNIEGVADFDGDGKTDLLLRDTSNNLTILTMNGTSAPTTVSLGTVTSTMHLLEIGTYYDTTAAKKKVALFFNDSSTGGKTVWYLNGNAIASQQALPSGFTVTSTTSNGTTTTVSYNILGVGDFNGDSNSDFLLQSQSDNTLLMRYSVYNGTNFAVYGDSSAYAAAPATWSLQGIAKVNGDIYSDWLWIVSGGTYPVLGYTPVSGSAGALSSIGYIRTGYALFKYTHL